DRQIAAAYKLLAQEEGVFVELASAASVAGLLQAHERGLVRPGERVVCTVTGNGLKDPDWAIAGAPAPITIPVDAQAAAAALELAWSSQYGRESPVMHDHWHCPRSRACDERQPGAGVRRARPRARPPRRDRGHPRRARGRGG